MSNHPDKRAFFRYLIMRIQNRSISRSEAAEWLAFELPERHEIEPQDLMGSCEWILRHADELSSTERELRYYLQCLRGDRAFAPAERDNIRGSATPIVRVRLGRCVWGEVYSTADYQGVVIVAGNPLLKPLLDEAMRTKEFTELLKWFGIRTCLCGQRRSYWVCSARLSKFLRELELYFSTRLSEGLA